VKPKLVLYDVCNDYSLDCCTTDIDIDPITKGVNLKIYRAVKRNNGIVYIHKKYDEIHYYLGKAGLTGQSLFNQ